MEDGNSNRPVSNDDSALFSQQQAKRRKLDVSGNQEHQPLSSLLSSNQCLPLNDIIELNNRLKQQQEKMIEIAQQAREEATKKPKKQSKRTEAFKKITRDDTEAEIDTNPKDLQRKTVLKKMETSTSGPLRVLYDCMMYGLKAKVWVRRYKGLRGVLTGYIVAFDGHMNLAMIDVDEVYTIESWMVGEPLKKYQKKKLKKKNEKILLKQFTEPPKENEEQQISSDQQIVQESIKKTSTPTTESTNDFLKKLTQNIKNQPKSALATPEIDSPVTLATDIWSMLKNIDMSLIKPVNTGTQASLKETHNLNPALINLRPDSVGNSTGGSNIISESNTLPDLLATSNALPKIPLSMAIDNFADIIAPEISQLRSLEPRLRRRTSSKSMISSTGCSANTRHNDGEKLKRSLTNFPTSVTSTMEFPASAKYNEEKWKSNNQSFFNAHKGTPTFSDISMESSNQNESEKTQSRNLTSSSGNTSQKLNLLGVDCIIEDSSAVSGTETEDDRMVIDESETLPMVTRVDMDANNIKDYERTVIKQSRKSGKEKTFETELKTNHQPLSLPTNKNTDATASLSVTKHTEAEKVGGNVESVHKTAREAKHKKNKRLTMDSIDSILKAIHEKEDKNTNYVMASSSIRDNAMATSAIKYDVMATGVIKDDIDSSSRIKDGTIATSTIKNSAFALNTIKDREIVLNTTDDVILTSSSIKYNEISSSKIKDGVIAPRIIKDGGVVSSIIKDGEVASMTQDDSKIMKYETVPIGVNMVLDVNQTENPSNVKTEIGLIEEDVFLILDPKHDGDKIEEDDDDDEDDIYGDIDVEQFKASISSEEQDKKELRNTDIQSFNSELPKSPVTNRNLYSIPETGVTRDVSNIRCHFVFYSIAERLNKIKTKRTLPRIEGKILKSTVQQLTPLFETSDMKSELSSTDEDSKALPIVSKAPLFKDQAMESSRRPSSASVNNEEEEDTGDKSEKKKKKKKDKKHKKEKKNKKKNNKGESETQNDTPPLCLTESPIETKSPKYLPPSMRSESTSLPKEQPKQKYLPPSMRGELVKHQIVSEKTKENTSGRDRRSKDFCGRDRIDDKHHIRSSMEKSDKKYEREKDKFYRTNESVKRYAKERNSTGDDKLFERRHSIEKSSKTSVHEKERALTYDAGSRKNRSQSTDKQARTKEERVYKRGKEYLRARTSYVEEQDIKISISKIEGKSLVEPVSEKDGVQIKETKKKDRASEKIQGALNMADKAVENKMENEAVKRTNKSAILDNTKKVVFDEKPWSVELTENSSKSSSNTTAKATVVVVTSNNCEIQDGGTFTQRGKSNEVRSVKEVGFIEAKDEALCIFVDDHRSKESLKESTLNKQQQSNEQHKSGGSELNDSVDAANSLLLLANSRPTSPVHDSERMITKECFDYADNEMVSKELNTKASEIFKSRTQCIIEKTCIKLSNPEATVMVQNVKEASMMVQAADEVPMPVESLDKVPMSMPTIYEASMAVEAANKELMTVQAVDEARMAVQPIGEAPITVQPVDEAPMAVQTAYKAPMAVQAVDEAPITVQALDEAPISVQAADEAPMTVQAVDEARMAVQAVDEVPITVQAVDEAPMAINTVAKMTETNIGKDLNETSNKKNIEMNLAKDTVAIVSNNSLVNEGKTIEQRQAEIINQEKSSILSTKSKMINTVLTKENTIQIQNIVIERNHLKEVEEVHQKAVDEDREEKSQVKTYKEEIKSCREKVLQNSTSKKKGEGKKGVNNKNDTVNITEERIQSLQLNEFVVMDEDKYESSKNKRIGINKNVKQVYEFEEVEKTKDSKAENKKNPTKENFISHNIEQVQCLRVVEEIPTSSVRMSSGMKQRKNFVDKVEAKKEPTKKEIEIKHTKEKGEIKNKEILLKRNVIRNDGDKFPSQLESRKFPTKKEIIIVDSEEEGELMDSDEEGEIDVKDRENKIKILKEESEIKDSEEEGEIKDSEEEECSIDIKKAKKTETKHKKVEELKEEEGELKDSDEEGEIKDSSDDGEIKDSEEEGEVKEDEKSAPESEKYRSSQKKRHKRKEEDLRRKIHKMRSKEDEREGRREKHRSRTGEIGPKEDKHGERSRSTERSKKEHKDVDFDAVRRYEEKWGKQKNPKDDPTVKDAMREKLLKLKRKKVLERLGVKEGDNEDDKSKESQRKHTYVTEHRRVKEKRLTNILPDKERHKSSSSSSRHRYSVVTKSSRDVSDVSDVSGVSDNDVPKRTDAEKSRRLDCLNKRTEQKDDIDDVRRKKTNKKPSRDVSDSSDLSGVSDSECVSKRTESEKSRRLDRINKKTKQEENIDDVRRKKTSKKYSRDVLAVVSDISGVSDNDLIKTESGKPRRLDRINKTSKHDVDDRNTKSSNLRKSDHATKVNDVKKDGEADEEEEEENLNMNVFQRRIHKSNTHYNKTHVKRTYGWLQKDNEECKPKKNDENEAEEEVSSSDDGINNSPVNERHYEKSKSRYDREGHSPVDDYEEQRQQWRLEANKRRQRERDDERIEKLSGITFIPKVQIKGMIYKRRHLNQLFIRGDNIVMVSNDKPENWEQIKNNNL